MTDIPLECYLCDPLWPGHMARYKPLRPRGGIDFNGNFHKFKPLGGNLDQLAENKLNLWEV